MMRFKLDENITDDLLAELAAIGHDAASCAAEGIAGAGDPAILAHATAESRILITCDLDFADIRYFVPGAYAGIVLLRLRQQDLGSTLAAVARLFATVPEVDFAVNLIIVKENVIRIRRPRQTP